MNPVGKAVIPTFELLSWSFLFPLFPRQVIPNLISYNFMETCNFLIILLFVY